MKYKPKYMAQHLDCVIVAHKSINLHPKEQLLNTRKSWLNVKVLGPDAHRCQVGRATRGRGTRPGPSMPPWPLSQMLSGGNYFLVAGLRSAKHLHTNQTICRKSS